LIIITI